MATHFVTAVRMEQAPGARHEHIGRLKLRGHTRDYARSEVVAAIKGGEVVYTNANPPALVYVRRCPECTASDYLTTSPDGTTKNNLLDLPRY